MSKLIVLLGFVLIIVSCKKDKEDPIPEVPEEIIRTIANPILYPRVEQLFPSDQQAVVSLPFLFSDTVQKRIVLTRESKVFLTFIAEKAVYKNSVGWYSYKLGSEPKNVKDIQKHLLFPNVSAKGEGGELLQGDMLQLGDTTFAKNTVIGFFIVLKGWQNGSINWGSTTHYTDQSLNDGAKQQHVLFKEKDSEDIVLGFEDTPFEIADKDFNDLIFKISDNKDNYKSISFDMKKLPAL